MTNTPGDFAAKASDFDPSPGLPDLDLASDLDLALRLGDVADGISLERFGAADLRIETKPDLTPVSDADLAVERAVREVLGVERPTDAVLGEEFGSTRPGAGREWVIDPIDGTKNFVRGVPIWATLIALMVDGIPAVGVVSAPALCRRWWAHRGGGAFASFRDDARRLRVSGVSELPDASASYSSLGGWVALGAADSFRELLQTCWRTRAFGDFYSYVLVAEGAVDIAAEPELGLWDLAALVPIVTEAGGVFTDIKGGAANRATTSALATNGLLHRVVLDRLGLSGSG